MFWKKNSFLYFNLNFSHFCNNIFSERCQSVFLGIFLVEKFVVVFSLIGKLAAGVKLEGKQWV